MVWGEVLVSVLRPIGGLLRHWACFTIQVFHVLVLIVMNIRIRMFARSKVTSTQVDLRRELSPRDLCQA